MIPENIVVSVNAAFDTYYQARSEELDLQISAAENQMAYDGLGRSGGALERYRGIYRDALRDCQSSLFTSFERTLEAYDLRLGSGLRQPMVDVIHGSLQPIASDFNQRLIRAANNAGIPLHKNLDNEVARLQTEARVKVGLLLARLQSKAVAGQKKWYERPIGLLLLGILIAVIGGLLLALLS